MHAHILFPAVMGTCGRAGPEMGVRADGSQYFRSDEYVLSNVKFADSPFSVPRLRIEKMDELGIDRQLLSPNPLTYFYHVPAADALTFARRCNDAMAEVCREYPRLRGAAMLPLQDVEMSCAELLRCAKELDLVASYLGTNVGGLPLSEPRFEALWSMHENLGLPVMLHSAPRGTFGPPGPFFSQWELEVITGFNVDEGVTVAHLLFAGVLDRHPRLHVHVAHGGGFAPYHKGRLRTALAKRPWAQNLLSRDFDDVWRQLSFDTAVHDRETLKFLVESEGADRVLLGSNFAGWDIEDDYQGLVASLGLSIDAETKILGGNAKRIFRLP